jgi:hypothetical protein
MPPYVRIFMFVSSMPIEQHAAKFRKSLKMEGWQGDEVYESSRTGKTLKVENQITRIASCRPDKVGAMFNVIRELGCPVYSAAGFRHMTLE